MPKAWYCRLCDTTYGPLRSAQLYWLAKLGKVTRKDAVRCGDKGRWTKAARVQGLVFWDDPRDAPAVDTGWHILVESRVSGPFAHNVLVDLARHGILSPADLVRRGENAPWIEAQRVKGLMFSLLPQVLTLGSGHDGANEVDGACDSCNTAQLEWKPARESGGAGTVTRRRELGLARVLLFIAVVVPCLLPRMGGSLPLVAELLIATASLAGCVALFVVLLTPDKSMLRWSLTAFLFTAIFGSTTLFQFSEFARAQVDRTISWSEAPLYLVREIGRAYELAIPQTGEEVGIGSLLQSTLYCISTIGVLEELLKMLPALVAASSLGWRRPVDFAFIGAISALGFGFAEGIWHVCGAQAGGEPTITTYLVRLVAGPLAHAVLTIIAIGFANQARLRLSMRDRVAIHYVLPVFGAILMAIPHGLYDALLMHGLTGIAGAIMVILAWTASDTILLFRD